jgi:hypothetical protein
MSQATCSGSDTTPVPAAEWTGLEKEVSDMGAINRDDVPVAIKDDNAGVRLSEAGDMTVSFIRFRQGQGSVRRSRACPAAYAPARTGAPCSGAGSR